jgi:hypothetical protein
MLEIFILLLLKKTRHCHSASQGPQKAVKLFLCEGEKPGLVVRAEGSRPRGRGFESHRMLDGCKRFASYYIKRKIENKGSQMGHTKKI